MLNLKTKYFMGILPVFFIVSIVCAREHFVYISTGVRDPMVKRIESIKSLSTQVSENAEIIKQNRQKELRKIIAESKVEGIVLGVGNKPLVMINNKIVAEGDRIAKNSNVYVAKIELKRVVFSLDNETVTYVLSPLKKDIAP